MNSREITSALSEAKFNPKDPFWIQILTAEHQYFEGKIQEALIKAKMHRSTPEEYLSCMTDIMQYAAVLKVKVTDGTNSQAKR